MFVLCRDYLKSIANQIGVDDVRFRRGSAQSKREIRIFSMPTRGSVSQITNKQNENARQGIQTYIDPNDRTPFRTTGVAVTDTSGNSGTTVKVTGALFVTNGVLADDYFHRNDNGKRSKIASVDDEDTLTLSDSNITANALSFHVSPQDGNQIVKRRVIKAMQNLTFVVQFNARTIAISEADFLNFNRNVGKYIHDAQFAEYYDEIDESTKQDIIGNPIKINLGAYEFLDNQHYGELQNSVLLEVEFVGGIYIVPDPTNSEIAVSNDYVVPASTLDV